MFPHSSSFRRERWTQALRRDKPLILTVDDDLATRELFASYLEPKVTRLSLLVRAR
jgi:hypothetical protein